MTTTDVPHVTVACVLKTGGPYGPDDVAKLAWGVQRQWPADAPPYSLLCLTDQPTMIEGLAHVDRVQPLRRGWPGFWSKMELFLPGVCPGPTLFLDLDTMLTKPMTWLFRRMPPVALQPPLVMLRDLRLPEKYGSGVMWWPDGTVLTHLYQRFRLDAPGYRQLFQSLPDYGDQAMIQHAMAERDQRVITWDQVLAPEDHFSCFSLSTQEEMEASALCYCSWLPKLGDRPNHPLVRDHWRIGP